jgi:hypothetical protein
MQGLVEYSGTTSAGGMGALNRASNAVLTRGQAMLEYLGDHIFVTVAILLGLLWVWHMLTRIKVR